MPAEPFTPDKLVEII
jgi:hypothetical protein